MAEEENIDLNDKKFLRIKDFKVFLDCLRQGLNIEKLQLNGHDFYKNDKLLLDDFVLNENINNYMDISL